MSDADFVQATEAWMRRAFAAEAMVDEQRKILAECRSLFVGTKPYVPIGIGILTDFTRMIDQIDRSMVSPAHRGGAA